ncbi:PREDICTED: nose resistant to fluoxetine protein 6-like isoform X1 [Rhagoletis zephyria]|uniref:nose resistant to fluoxetine protein 6-like isoform X1 n=1 Tax=Rhagoletis zephyria TaxID=28612 RepID=UPI000811355B|nr:PREDICTED: nose resistant to fluoxetine protein 6-like isoform X1 [Rhagoletis zephyria]
MHEMKIKILFLCQLIALAGANDVSKANTSQPVSMTQHNLHETFQRTSILYGLSVVSNEQFIELRCHTHLQLFQHGVIHKEAWALKMFDASATLEPGFTFGHNFWLGNSEVCSAVGHEVHMQISAYLPHQMNEALLTSVAPFDTGFRVVYLRHNLSWQVDPHVTAFGPRVHVGLCLPSACAEHDVRRLMKTYLSRGLFAGNELFEMHLQYDYMKDLQWQAAVFMRPSFYICCAFVVVTIGLTAVAVSSRKSERMKAVKKKTTEALAAMDTPSSNSSHYTVDSNSQAVIQQQFEGRSFITCFDIAANWQRIFVPPKLAHTFAALNGLRFGSALCVTLYHYLMFLCTGTRNKLTLFNYQVRIGNVDIFVDIFFALSGFLQAYNHFRNVKLLKIIRKNNFVQNLKLIGSHLFHRYLRLAPMYFLVIAMSDFGAALFDNITLFHIEHKIHVNCAKYWWRNVFFIQNFYDHNDACALWTWSLACDMQFSILASVLLFTYVKHPRRTKLCLAALVIANILYTYAVGLKLNFDHTLESTFTHLTEIYTNPLSRILAYICGCIAGWWFVEQRRLPFALSRSMQQFCGLLLPLVVLGCILKPAYANLSPLAATSILLLERIIFSLACSILLMANAYGQMRWFFRFFESIVFQKFNQVSYAIFMLNPIFIFALPGFSQSNLYANPLNLLFEYIGVVVTLVLFSTLFTLLFDIPYQNLSRLLIIRQVKRKIA